MRFTFLVLVLSMSMLASCGDVEDADRGTPPTTTVYEAIELDESLALLSDGTAEWREGETCLTGTHTREGGKVRVAVAAENGERVLTFLPQPDGLTREGTTIQYLTGSALEQARLKADDFTASDVIREIEKGIPLYRLETGRFPDELSELTEPVGVHDEGLLTLIPSDPWGNEYSYDPQGGTRRKYLLSSKGRDGTAGTEDDISSDALLPKRWER